VIFGPNKKMQDAKIHLEALL